ncbi:MAG: hypothetical protein JWL67_2651 [Solirubrobacterales bacterium]|nr:hypothetical protein [Solirubrobacterales bacterium]
MERYAAFLRGVNVGAHHRVSNADLQRMFTALGLLDVAPFRTSGNVAFMAERGPTGRLTSRIEDMLAQELGYAVSAFVRTAQEVRTIAAIQPFPPELVRASAGKLQVSLLGALPEPKMRAELLSLASDSDLLAFGACELYWLPSGGILDSPLDLKAIDGLTGPATRRTKNTIEQIAAKHFAD